MERKRILVAFGDLRGFRRWLRRVVTTPEESGDFIDKIYTEFENFTRYSNCYVKYLGDGLLIVKELKKGNNQKLIAQFLRDVAHLSDKVGEIVFNYYPRVSGFRMRVASGYAFKRFVMKRVGRNFTKHPEYIESVVNMTRDLLFVKPEVSLVCHESILDLLKSKKKGFIFSPLKNVKDWPISLDQEDVEGLYVFRPEGSVDKNFN